MLIENWLSPLLIARADSRFPQDEELVGAYILELPMTAKLMIVLAMFVGGMVSVFVARLITREVKYPAIAVAAIMLLFTISNLVSIPHPTWMSIAMPLAIVLGSILAWLATKPKHMDSFSFIQ